MKRANSASLILFVWAMLSLTGCKTTQPASNSAANNSPATASASGNSNRAEPSPDTATNANTSTQGDAAAKSSGPPPKLEGAYEAREVHDQGVVTLMSAVSTVIYFSPDGTYSRVSQKEGKIYHRDSGQFRIEAPDKLKLIIQTSDRKIQTPPLERTHTFSLSPDGEELKMTSDKSSVAVFRRVSAPKK